MSDEYLTVSDRATSRFVVKGSEFIGHVRPVDTREEAEEFITAVKRKYDDATHNVPAYRVRTGPDGDLLRAYSSDDGEPSGSAGKPALNVLAQRNLENCVAVVTRYYGGTNLGVGGLVRAYSRAVSDAVEGAGTVERRPHERVSLTAAYDDSGTVRAIIESEGYDFEADYREVVSFDVRVPRDEVAPFTDRLKSGTSGRIEIE